MPMGHVAARNLRKLHRHCGERAALSHRVRCGNRVAQRIAEDAVDHELLIGDPQARELAAGPRGPCATMTARGRDTSTSVVRAGSASAAMARHIAHGALLEAGERPQTTRAGRVGIDESVHADGRVSRRKVCLVGAVSKIT